jgi:hypothetical protein
MVTCAAKCPIVACDTLKEAAQQLGASNAACAAAHWH